METKKEQKKRGPPDSKVTITSRKNANFYVNVAKNALTNFETIELHALGTAMTVSVAAADMLIK